MSPPLASSSAPIKPANLGSPGKVALKTDIEITAVKTLNNKGTYDCMDLLGDSAVDKTTFCCRPFRSLSMVQQFTIANAC